MAAASTSEASAVVTGGAAGLGLAAARRLVARGIHVVVADLPSADRSHLDELGSGVTFVATDVSVTADVRHAVAMAAEKGALRVAVACAGVAAQGRILGSKGPLDLDEFAAVVAVNLTGSAALLVESATVMAGNEPAPEDRGVVVLTSSIAAYDGGSLAYSASKAGVAGMTLAAAQNLAPHAIRVVSIAPGLFETKMFTGMPASLQRLVDQVPHPRRTGQPDEFARLMEHIVDNGMLNGEVIRLDAAMRLMTVTQRAPTESA